MKQTSSDCVHVTSSLRTILRPDAIAEIPAEVARLGCRRLMLITSASTARTEAFARIRALMGPLVVAVIDDMQAHTPADAVMAAARLAAEARIDGLIAIGGGSCSDAAKAVNIVLAEGGDIADHATVFDRPEDFVPKSLPEPKLPLIAVPITASAAEVTSGLGVSFPDGSKRIYWDDKLAARVIVIDPLACTEVPANLVARTAMNALAHCVEALYSRQRNPITDGLAHHGLRLLHAAIPAMAAAPEEIGQRAAVMMGAHISGLVITNARVGIHHGICHGLGAMGHLGHGEANSIMLPHAMVFNLPVAVEEIAGMAVSMGLDVSGLDLDARAHAAIDAVRLLQRHAGVPVRLRDTTLDRALLPAIAEHTMHDPVIFFNPRRPASAAEVLDILERAW
jgi:alcohol dehydrogenase class IV